MTYVVVIHCIKRTVNSHVYPFLLFSILYIFLYLPTFQLLFFFTWIYSYCIRVLVISKRLFFLFYLPAFILSFLLVQRSNLEAEHIVLQSGKLFCKRMPFYGNFYFSLVLYTSKIFSSKTFKSLGINVLYLGEHFIFSRKNSCSLVHVDNIVCMYAAQISEPQTGIEPAILWTALIRSNHWATELLKPKW